MNIDDETLILHYYDDGLDAAERRRIDAALRDDPALALHYLELTAALAQLRIAPDARPSAAALHRWQTGLARAARLETAVPERSRWRAWPVWIGGAVAASAVLAFALWTTPDSPPIQPRPIVAVQPADAALARSPASLQRGIQRHLQDAGARLQGLPAMDVDDRAAVVNAILDRHRIYLRAADDQDADRMARALRAFEPALLRLADTRTDTPTLLAEHERLTFELGVIQSQLAHAPPA